MGQLAVSFLSKGISSTQFSQEQRYWRDSNSQPLALQVSALLIKLTWLDFFYIIIRTWIACQRMTHIVKPIVKLNTYVSIKRRHSQIVKLEKNQKMKIPCNLIGFECSMHTIGLAYTTSILWCIWYFKRIALKHSKFFYPNITAPQTSSMLYVKPLFLKQD